MVKQVIKMPEFPDLAGLENIESRGSFWDSQDLTNMNSTLIMTVLSLKEINRQITEYSRQKTIADLEYKRKYRSLMIGLEAKTETLKKQMAEKACEEEEYKIAVLDEIIKELNRIAADKRTQLDTLKVIAFNLRQEMKIQ